MFHPVAFGELMSDKLQLFQGSFGQEITVQLIEDNSNETINDATSFEVHIEKPDDSVIVRTTGITKVDSKNVKYSTEATETDLKGTYKVNVFFKKTGEASIPGVTFFYHVVPLFTGQGNLRRGANLLSGANR